jgi:hypothetical protein
MPSVQLNFINNSEKIPNTNIVVFQKNIGGNSVVPETPVAWMVFPNEKGLSHSFSYPFESTIAASDSYGKTTSKLNAENWNRFDMVSSAVGNELLLSPNQASGPRMEVYNELPVGAINAMVYKNGLLLAEKTSIGPGQFAGFAFEPTLYIILTNGIEQGEIMNTASISDINFQFSLLGISSADIVMAGGGTGTDATPIVFSLQNVKMA